MSNIILIYSPAVESKKITRTSANKTTCEYVEESSAPLPCEEGDKVILFFKDADVVTSDSGVILGDIISRRFENGQYSYTIQYDDALLSPGILPNTLTQCDVLKACCYDCAAEYSDRPILVPPVIVVSEDDDNVIIPGSDGGAYIDCEDIAACVVIPAPPVIPPEHTTLTGELQGGYTGPIAIDAVGVVVGAPTALMVVNNPSLVRDLATILNFNVYMRTQSFDGTRVAKVYLSVDGGAFFNFMSDVIGPFTYLRTVSYKRSYFLNYLIPAGGSVNFSLRTDVDTSIAGTVGEVIQNVAYSFNFTGSTV